MKYFCCLILPSAYFRSINPQCISRGLSSDSFIYIIVHYFLYYTKISLQCENLTKPVCLTDVTCASLKRNGGIWLKLYGIVSFILWIDLYLFIISTG